MKHKIFIDGQEGTTGLRIKSRLEARPELEILKINEEERKNIETRAELIKKSDITFLCLPDAASKEIVLKAGENGKIIDASTAHRVNDNWVYGFPEISKGQREKIKNSNRVSVPGCHATGFISIARPLVELGIVNSDYPFSCHSITGYSGGGKPMIANYENESRSINYDSPSQYALMQGHKHLPEMKKQSKILYAPVFNPIVADFYNGMLLTVPLHKRLLSTKMGSEEIIQSFKEFYKGENFVKVRNSNEFPEDGLLYAGKLADKDNLEIFIFGSDENLAIMARYDNLGKGASGAAIQCMNIMLGIPETDGLSLVD